MFCCSTYSNYLSLENIFYLKVYTFLPTFSNFEKKTWVQKVFFKLQKSVLDKLEKSLKKITKPKMLSSWREVNEDWDNFYEEFLKRIAANESLTDHVMNLLKDEGFHSQLSNSYSAPKLGKYQMKELNH